MAQLAKGRLSDAGGPRFESQIGRITVMVISACIYIYIYIYIHVIHNMCIYIYIYIYIHVYY